MSLPPIGAGWGSRQAALRPRRQDDKLTLMDTQDSLLWSQMSMAKVAYPDIAGAVRDLDCRLCGAANGWLDYDVWLLRYPDLSALSVGSGVIYLCRGCLKTDGDKDLWGGAVLLAVERSMIGDRPPPVFVSVVHPSTRLDNHRCRWIEWL